MKKLLVIILLLTFTSLVYAGEGRYTMVLDEDYYGVYILDSKDGSVKFCQAFGNTDKPPKCSPPSED
jgi:hypothetical protein